MAGRIDVTAFCPDIPEGASSDEKFRILLNALAEIRTQIAFSLGHIRVRDMNASAVEEIIASAESRIVTGILAAKRWSDYESGEKIPKGTFFWYDGVLWESLTGYMKYDDHAPGTEVGEVLWAKVS